MGFQARQGDIFFKSVEFLPNTKMTKKNDNVLAYGELTGHSHTIIHPPISEMQMQTDKNGDIYVLSENKNIQIGHDEHDIVILPKGKWICISRQREYDPLLAEKQRIIAD